MGEWRVNLSGKAPCESGIMVMVEFGDRSKSEGYVEDFYWRIDGDSSDICRWKFICDQTESPEEREALDMIGTTSKQVESLANNSELPNSSKCDRSAGGHVKLIPPEWIGEGLPPVGAECEAKSGSLKDWFKGVVVAHDGDFAILKMEDDYPFNAVYAGFESRRLRRIESESDKLNIERLESAYDLWLTWCHGCDVDNSMSIEQFATLGSCPGYLAIVDKTGYRKDQK